MNNKYKSAEYIQFRSDCKKYSLGCLVGGNGEVTCYKVDIVCDFDKKGFSIELSIDNNDFYGVCKFNDSYKIYCNVEDSPKDVLSRFKHGERCEIVDDDKETSLDGQVFLIQ